MNRTPSHRAGVLGASLAVLATLAGVSHASDSTAQLAESSVAPATPAWPVLYRKYLAEGTVGDCASCHAEAATPDGAYDWLAGQQYMAGSPLYLVDLRTSCFSWFGGDMPPDGPSSYTRARTDFNAWADAGASKD